MDTWWSTVLLALLNDYSLDKVYKVDEFGWFNKLMPNKSFEFNGGKLSKECPTILACENATGIHKSPLFIARFYFHLYSAIS